MLRLRAPLLQLRRCYAATTFIPPASLRDIQHDPAPDHSAPDPSLRLRPRPESPFFYTARAQYHDQIHSLQSSLHYSRDALRILHLLPLPQFARDALPPSSVEWKPRLELEDFMQCRLSMAKYRFVLKLLQELNEYQRIAAAAGCVELADCIAAVLQLFTKAARDLSMEKKKAKMDEFGRCYAVGRRKTSTARVWVIRAKQPPPPKQNPFKKLSPSPSEELAQILRPALPIITSQILINNMPLSTYFPLPADREKIVRPLKIAGVLGGYNVFAIVRGGGVTGQSGAVALGLAKGLAALEPEVEQLLKKAKLLRRDPRMVERKKTGLPKARKRYAWVRR